MSFTIKFYLSNKNVIYNIFNSLLNKIIKKHKLILLRSSNLKTLSHTI